MWCEVCSYYVASALFNFVLTAVFYSSNVAQTCSISVSDLQADSAAFNATHGLRGVAFDVLLVTGGDG